MQPWQAEMRRLKIEYFKSISKEFYRLNGGDNMTVRPYSDNTTSGLIHCIIDYLGYHGCCAEAGFLISGYQSIKAEIGGKQILITVRVKKLKNRKGGDVANPHSPKAGQLHFTAQDMPSFMQWCKQALNLGSSLCGNSTNSIVTQ